MSLKFDKKNLIELKLHWCSFLSVHSINIIRRTMNCLVSDLLLRKANMFRGWNWYCGNSIVNSRLFTKHSLFHIASNEMEILSIWSPDNIIADYLPILNRIYESNDRQTLYHDSTCFRPHWGFNSPLNESSEGLVLFSMMLRHHQLKRGLNSFPIAGLQILYESLPKLLPIAM